MSHFFAAIEDLVKSVANLFAGIFNTIANVIGGFLTMIVNFFSSFVNLITGTIEGLAQMVGGLGKFIAGTVFILTIASLITWASQTHLFFRYRKHRPHWHCRRRRRWIPTLRPTRQPAQAHHSGQEDDLKAWTTKGCWRQAIRVFPRPLK